MRVQARSRRISVDLMVRACTPGGRQEARPGRRLAVVAVMTGIRGAAVAADSATARLEFDSALRRVTQRRPLSRRAGGPGAGRAMIVLSPMGHGT